MSQNLQNFVKFQKIQLENLVDFEKCCKTHIFLQKSKPIQPKTSNILPKFCQPTLSEAGVLEALEHLGDFLEAPRLVQLLRPEGALPVLQELNPAQVVLPHEADLGEIQFRRGNFSMIRFFRVFGHPPVIRFLIFGPNGGVLSRGRGPWCRFSKMHRDLCAKSYRILARENALSRGEHDY